MKADKYVKLNKKSKIGKQQLLAVSLGYIESETTDMLKSLKASCGIWTHGIAYYKIMV